MPQRRPWRTVRAALAAVLLVPALMLIGPPSALACSCADIDMEGLLSYVDTVAVGELTAMDPPPERPDGAVSSDDQITYTATLRTVLKGEPDNPLVFRSATHGASCGLEGMTIGQDYVFFVRGGESGLCDGTSRATPQLIADVEAVTGPGQEVSAAEPDPTTVPDPTTAPEAAPNATSESGSIPVLWPALAAGSMVLLAVGWLLWRRSFH